jgi:hypothetical protein
MLLNFIWRKHKIGFTIQFIVDYFMIRSHLLESCRTSFERNCKKNRKQIKGYVKQIRGCIKSFLVHSVEEFALHIRQMCENSYQMVCKGRKMRENKRYELDNCLKDLQELAQEEARTECIKAKMASGTQVTMEEGLGLATEIESMNFKDPSLITKNAEIIVNHQMFDEIPQPNQTALRISESIGVEIIDLMWKNLRGTENLTLVMKTTLKIVVTYSTANCVNVCLQE